MMPANQPASLLKVHQLSVSYGSIEALAAVELSVAAGELVCLIGANGAGKSSVLKAIAGLLRPHGGQIFFRGEALGALSADQRLRRGLALVPEGRGIFHSLSVAENLRLGAYIRRDRDAVASELETIFQRLPRLRERLGQRAGTLSGGEQQMLALARALLARPQLLLLDEPSLGLAPVMVAEVYRFIADIRAEGVAILLVEQNTELALAHASQAYLLNAGRIELSGDSASLRAHPALRRSYLGY